MSKIAKFRRNACRVIARKDSTMLMCRVGQLQWGALGALGCGEGCNQCAKTGRSVSVTSVPLCRIRAVERVFKRVEDLDLLRENDLRSSGRIPSKSS